MTAAFLWSPLLAGGAQQQDYNAAVNVYPPGLTVSVGTVTVTHNAEIFPVDGTAAAVSLGAVTVTTDVNQDVTGLSLPASVGSVQVTPFPVPITITNPGADVDVSGWTNIHGTISRRTASPAPYSGDGYFFGGANAYTAAYQDLAVPSERHTDTDKGWIEVRVEWRGAGFSGDTDKGRMAVMFLDGSGYPIHARHSPLTDYVTDTWNLYVAEWRLPPGTRTIRLFQVMVRAEGTNNDAYHDAIAASFIEITPRPFTYWTRAPIADPNGDDGVAAAWTLSGTNHYTETAVLSSTYDYPYYGTGLYSGSDGGSLTYAEQVVDFPAGVTADIDAGDATLHFFAGYGNNSSNETIRFKIDFLDAGNSPVGTQWVPLDQQFQNAYTLGEWSVAIPSGARKAKLRFECTQYLSVTQGWFQLVDFEIETPNAPSSGGVTVEVTGVSATASVGTATVEIDAPVTVTGLSATSSVGTATVTVLNPQIFVSWVEFSLPVASGDVSVPVTGVAATASVGSVTVIGTAIVDATGIEVTASVGTATVIGTAVVTATGLEAVSSVGTVTVEGDAVVTQDGLALTSSVGGVTVFVVTIVPVTGVEAVSATGTVAVETDALVSVTGLEASSATGTVTLVTDQILDATGVEATASVGTAEVQIDVDAQVTGTAATASVGEVAVTGAAVVTATGNALLASVGDVTVSAGGSVVVEATGVEVTTSVGNVTLVTDQILETSGLQAVAEVGNVTLVTDQVIDVTGVEGLSQTGTVTVEIDVAIVATGVEGVSAVGTATVTVLNPQVFVSWIEFALPIQQSGDALVDVTGVAATISTGTVDVVGTAIVTVSGTSATGAVGTVTLETDQILDVTGVSAAAEVGQVTVDTAGNVDVVVTGVSGQSSVGTATVSAGMTHAATGVSATAEVGTAGVTGAANVDLAGVAAIGAVGQALAAISVAIEVSGVGASGAVGTGAAQGGATVSATGIEAIILAGSTDVSGDANVDVTGVEGSLAAGSVVVTTTDVSIVVIIDLDGTFDVTEAMAGDFVIFATLQGSAVLNAAGLTGAAVKTEALDGDFDITSDQGAAA